MALTAKQESFCLAYVETGNASEAYRRSYKGDAMKPETVWRNASGLLDNTKVLTRVQELQAELAKKSAWTRERAAEILIGIADNLGAKDPDRINAVKVLNTMHGFDGPVEHRSGDTITVKIVDATGAD